jgi:beta-lactamase regulating signal transducer with metallopeptidase domain
MLERVDLRSVVLSESTRVSSPLLLGTREICLPADKLAEFDDAEVDTIFAHELAHAERHDGIWFPIAGFVQSVFWFQPLNHYVARRFRQSAELACDDRAVELTGDARRLAAVLTRVAVSLTASIRAVPTMAGSAKTLVLRVRRLVSAQPFPREDVRRARLALTVLGVIGIASIGFDIRAARATSAPPPSPSTSVAERPVEDALELNRELEALLQREHELENELARAELISTDPDNAPRLLELRQELDHARAMQRWTEERYLESSDR